MELKGLLLVLGKTVWEFSEEGGGNPNGDWIDLFAAIGETSWNYLFGDIQLCSDYSAQPALCSDCYELVESRVNSLVPTNGGGSGGISPELDSQLQGALPIFITFAVTFTAFGLLKFIWAIGRKIYQFFDMCFGKI
jgi:hypothetical protein